MIELIPTIEFPEKQGIMMSTNGFKNRVGFLGEWYTSSWTYIIWEIV